MSMQEQNRLDAFDIAFLNRELRHVDPVSYPTLFAGILGRKYIPKIDGVSPLVNEYQYTMATMVGDAKLGAPGASDATRISVSYTPFVSSIKQIPVSLSWTTRELKQSAAFVGGKLQDDTIRAAMSFVERRRDNMLALGVTGTTIGGLLNNASVNTTTASTKTGTGAGTLWIRAVPVVPDEILSDISRMVSACRTQLKQASLAPGGDNLPAFARWVLLLDEANYTYISQTPRSSTSDRTILQWALTQNPWLESIEEWNQCDTAAAGGNHIGVLYPRDVMCVGCLIPDEWSMENWQYEGHNVVVPANGSCGGTVVKYPVACQYLTGQ